MPKAPQPSRIRHPNGRPARAPLSGGTAAVAAMSAASGGTLALSAAHSYSLIVLVVSGATSIILALVSAFGGQAADLLWTILYSRMMKALVREGISHITDMADVHHLMADLRGSAAGLRSNRYDTHK